MTTISKNKRRAPATSKTNNRRNNSSKTNNNRRAVSVKSNNKNTSKQARRSSTNSIENGVNVIRLALRKKISVSAAAKQSGFGRNYISDIKSRLEDNYKSKKISKELYTSFVNLNKEYKKTTK